MIIKKTQHTIHVVLKTVTGGWAGVFEVWTKNADTKKKLRYNKKRAVYIWADVETKTKQCKLEKN